MGDIIAGCEDKTIRIFTRDTTRQDDGPEFEKLEKAIKDNTKPQGEAPNLADLKEFTTEIKGKVAGTKQGEIKVFKDAGVGKAYMWDMTKMEWECIGEVINPAQAMAGGGGNGAVGGQGGGTKQYPGDALFAAGEYDHIFDVDLGDGIMR